MVRHASGMGGRIMKSMNKRVLVIAAVGILALGAGVFVSFGPSDSSSQQGAVQPVFRHRAVASHGSTHSKPQEQVVQPVVARADLMPASFRILLTRSIFSEGGQAAAAAVDRGTSSGLALRGILQQGAAFFAFIEDSTHGDARQVKVGDALAGGTITAIDLHGLELACSGRRTRVQVGQTLGNGLLVGMPSAPAIADSPANDASRVASIR